MKYLVTLCIFIFTHSAVSDDNPVSSKFDINFNRVISRNKALDWIKNPPSQQVELLNLGLASNKQIRFLSYLKNTWAPYVENRRIHIFKHSVYEDSLERALFNNEEERIKWGAISRYHMNEANKIYESRVFQVATNKLHSLSKGLNGEVVELAEKIWMEMNEYQSSKKEESLSYNKNINNHISKIRDQANTSKVTLEDMQKSFEKKLQIETKYYTKQVNLQTAARQIDELAPYTREAKAQYLAETMKHIFNELATKRTVNALNHNYESHADFVFSKQQSFYAPGMKTPKQRIKVLKDIVSKTKPLINEIYFKLWSKRKGLPDFNKMTSTELSLLLPETDSLVSKYFIKENANNFWRKFFSESGFPMEQLNELVVDSFPRKGKRVNAYMTAHSMRIPKLFTVDAQSLNVIAPNSNIKNWHQARITILQNLMTDTPKSYRTVGHEHGHFWDYANRKHIEGPFKLFKAPNIASRGETPSKAMERVLEDREFLLSNLKDKNEIPISEKILDQYLLNLKIQKLLETRKRALGALFDYTLWDYQFTNNSETFVQRARRLTLKFANKYELGAQSKHYKVDPSYAFFSTAHFYSGKVAYDYFYADQTAEIVHLWLLDKFSIATGRRTYLNQPSMAKLLIKNLYNSTASTVYPQSIEAFTNRKFNLENIVRTFTETASDVIKNINSSHSHIRVALKCSLFFSSI